MKRLTHLHIETGPAGWLKAFWRREDEPENVVFVQFRVPSSKRQGWAIVGLRTSKNSRPKWLSADLLSDIPLSRIESAIIASSVFRSGLEDRINDEQPADLDAAFKGMYREVPRTTLERPGKLDDAFLRQVALAYRQAVAAGRPPLKTMADDSGIPQGTIARWVARAREGHFLPDATPGKVSA